MPKKKIWANFQRILELFTQKIVPDPGIRIRNTGYKVTRYLQQSNPGMASVCGSEFFPSPDTIFSIPDPH